MTPPQWHGDRNPQWPAPGQYVPQPQEPPTQQIRQSGVTGDQPPPRPAAVLVAAALGGVVALALFGLALHVLVTGVGGATGALSVIAVVLLACIVAGMAALYGIGLAGLLHRRFPNTAQLAMATWMTAVIVGVAMVRSARGWTDGSDGPLTFAAWTVMLVVVALLVLMSRPAVVRWIQATHEHSRRLGYAPRQRRR
ncbi:hypothetical protein GCM10025787_12380 [Saccharopolyspora rosea]|uniref:Uncharacterized protein n=1 Tax=Saccharopolyspora rosea TaxID=524884 RepID=A0ABW3FUW2_9PSEU